MSALGKFFNNLTDGIHLGIEARYLKKCQRRFAVEKPATSELNKKLGYALETGFYNAALYFLEQGANPNSTAYYPQKGYDSSHDQRHFFRMAEKGDFKGMQMLLEAGADVDGRSNAYNRNFTPLQCAVQDSERKTVAFLLAAGADLSATFHGKTALDYAQEGCFDDIAQTITDEDARRKSPTPAAAAPAIDVSTNAIIQLPQAVKPKAGTKPTKTGQTP